MKQHKNIKNYQNLLYLFLLAMASSCNSNGESKTFFRPRSAIEDVTLFLGLNNYNIYRSFYAPHTSTNEQNSTIFIAAGAFFEQSTNGKQLAQYFLPNNKSCVSIQENGLGDIGSLWLELIAPETDLYSSTFKIRPQRCVIGAYFNYHQNFCPNERLWIDGKFALYEAVHKLNACEEVHSRGGIVPDVSNALNYFSSSALNYGKISNCQSKVFGVDDLEFKLGYEVYTNQNGQLSIYGSGLIPTANKATPNQKKLFEAVVGRGHGAIGAGFNGGLNFLDCPEKSLTGMIDFSYQYLFSRCEKRSFDLCPNGDWSRYLKVIKNNEITNLMEYNLLRIFPTPNTMTTSEPAINYVTQCASVTPRSVINLWTALHYQHCNAHLETGYNLWWKQAEKICLNKNRNIAVGIFNLNNTPPARTYVYSENISTPVTASTATINQSRTLNGTSTTDVVSDTSFIDITTADFNLKSASHPSTLTNKLYAAFSFDTPRYSNIGVGGSFEFTNKNAVQQWGVWTNIQVMF